MDGVLDIIREFQGEYRFLSNFWPCRLIIDGKSYATVEHYYQSMKFEDHAIREHVRLSETPGEAKRAGRTFKMKPNWEAIKDNVMTKGVTEKFKQNPDLRARLLKTGNAILEEGNTWNDTYWGKNLSTGEGLNKLGKILMKIREKLRGV